MSADNRSASSQAGTGSNWLLRILAAIIDSIPWMIIGSIVFFVLWNPDVWLTSTFLAPILYGLLYVTYCIVIESSSFAATLGKKVVGLKVQTLEGGRATINKAFVRNISKIFWVVFLVDIVIGVATHGPDPRQRYFDRLAGTTVVSVKQIAENVPPPPPPPS